MGHTDWNSSMGGTTNKYREQVFRKQALEPITLHI